MNIDYNETQPTKQSVARNIDEYIRIGVKEVMRERLQAEHAFYADETGKTDIGEHRKGSARVDFGISTGKPSVNESNPGRMFISTDTDEIEYDNGTEWNSVVDLIIRRVDTFMQDKYYPVGSLYFNVTNDADPGSAEVLGFGTWTRVSGRTLIGVDITDEDFFSGNIAGGSKTHTLTVDEMPAHTHDYYRPSLLGRNLENDYQEYTGSGKIATSTSTGGGQAHNNLPPYLTVHIWRRIA